MMMGEREIVGSAYWVVAIFNGDESGMEDQEVRALDRWMDREVGLGEHIVGIRIDPDTGVEEDPWFTWSYGLHCGVETAGGECVTYVVLTAA